jgi:hypothetical protein
VIVDRHCTQHEAIDRTRASTAIATRDPIIARALRRKAGWIARESR